MKTLSREIPGFALYGDNTPIDNAPFVHVETIEAHGAQYGWDYGPHEHHGLYQAVFLMSGHASAQVETMLWECDGPMVLPIHPGVLHAFRFSPDTQGYVLTVDRDLVSSLDLFVPVFARPLALRLHERPDLRDRLAALLHQLWLEGRAPHYGKALLSEWLARSVLLMLVRLETERRLADESGQAEFELFSRFRALVEEHYRAQWSVGRYAEALDVTAHRLNRLCLKLAGKSAFEMAQDRLLLEACRSLTYVPAPIAAISSELGFPDPAYFSRLFRKRMGVTPKEFRERAWREEAAQG